MKNKRGLIGKIILITLLVLILIVASLVIYFYYFHTFKEFKICIENQNPQDIRITCTTNQECLTIMKNNSEFNNALTTIESLPPTLKTTANQIITESIICQETCKIKNIKGEPFTDPVESCNPADKEINIQIKGKEGLEILKFIKNNAELMN